METDASLEAMLPCVRYRQWTLGVPFSLRFTVVKEPALVLRLDRSTLHQSTFRTDVLRCP